MAVALPARRRLGAEGPLVSPLGLGTVKFAQTNDDAACHRLIDQALDHGITLIDTAHVYGRSEAIIGAALAANKRRDDAFLATKIAPQQNDRASIIAQTDCALRRLRTDRIDLMQLHRPSPTIPIDDTLGALDELVQAGKVCWIGSSGFKAWQLMEALWCASDRGHSRLISEQTVYSLLARRCEDELLPMARSYGLGLILWSPLGAGVLTDRYTRARPPAHMPLSDTAWRVIDTLRAIAAAHECSASQIALAWCLTQPGVCTVLAGPRTAEQLSDNLGAMTVELTDADRAAFDAVAAPGWTERDDWVGRCFSQAHTFRWGGQAGPAGVPSRRD